MQVIDGTATKVRLRLASGPHTRRDGLPDQMCVKGGFGVYREYLGGMGLYSGEVRFFDEIAPLYELARPASYFGLAQTDPVQGIVAMEDLQARGVTFARATRPLSVKLAAAGLDALVALHGQSWGDERPRPLGVEPLLSATTEPIVRDFFAACRSGSPHRAVSPPRSSCTTRIGFVRRTRPIGPRCSAARCQRGPRRRAHRQRLRRTRRARGFRRLADRRGRALGTRREFFLVSALDVPDRRAHERDLLGYYLKALATFGVSAPGLDEAWSDYRRATVYGFWAGCATWTAGSRPR